MFSSTTMAASTTMPTANARPASEMTLIERPSAAMATNAPTTDTGMASEITTVARNERRNNSSSSAAKLPPTQMFCCTSAIAELMYTVSSYTCRSARPASGTAARFNSATASSMPRMVSMTLAPVWRVALKAMEARPR